MPADLVLPESTEALISRGLSARELSLRTDSINEEQRSFEAVVASESPVAVLDRRTYDVVDEVLIAEGGDFPEHMPLLPNHSRYDVLDVIGSAVDFRRQSTDWMGRGIVASPVNDQDEVAAIWRRIAERHIRAVSIGYHVHDFFDIPSGRSETIDGRQWKAGQRTLRITMGWRAHELSITPIGADEKALIRSRMGDIRPTNRSFFAR